MRRQYASSSPESATQLRSIADVRDLAFAVLDDMRHGRLDLKSGAILGKVCQVALQAAALAGGATSDDRLNSFGTEIQRLIRLVESDAAPSVRYRALMQLSRLGVSPVPG